MKTTECGSVLRAGRESSARLGEAGRGSCAQRFCGCRVPHSSLVLTHPYTWLPLPAPSQLQGLPRGRGRRERVGGGSQNHTGSPPSPLGRGKLPPQRQGGGWFGRVLPFWSGSKDARPGLGEWGRVWFVRNRVYVRGREDLGVVLGPLIRGTELGLEILGPRAFCSSELSFLVHIMGRQRGDTVLWSWK